MKKEPKVSVIVPVYNVEKYLKKCIDSLIKQTYSNAEFIFVDDGSPDNSYKIINEAKNKDKRIFYYKQKNSGVSSARNVGIKHSTGDYLVFVDADDYLSYDFLEYMLSLICENDCDFAYSINNFSSEKEEQSKKLNKKIVSNDESCALLLSPNVTVGCWNKIYKKDLITKNNIYFNEKLFYGEGLQFIIDVSLAANKICVGNKKVYFYRKNNANSATTNFSIDKIINGEKSLLLIKDKINLSFDYVKSMYTLHMATYYLASLVSVISSKNNQYKKECKQWKKYINENVLYIILSKYISLYRKLLIIGGFISPRIISFLDKYRRSIIIKRSVK